MAQKVLDIGVHSYGVHFQFQLDSRLTRLNLRLKSKLGKEMSDSTNTGSANVLYPV